MTVKLTFSAEVKDTEDIRGLREQIGMCFEELGDVRLTGVYMVDGSTPQKAEYGAYGKVLLTDGGYRELVARFGRDRVDRFIDRLSWKLHQKNYKFKDHYAVIVEWIEEESNTSAANAQSFDVDEFFNAAVKRGVDGDA